MRLGIDLGGTKIEIVALDEDGSECLRRRIATPQGDYTATVKAITELVQAAEAALAQTATVGVGMPGAVSARDGRVKNANSVCLNGQPLKQDLEAALQRKVRLANDANCFALSEAIDGAAAGAGSVFGVILGTGTGGGVVINGQILEGANAIAGEWGHNPLPWPTSAEWPGPECYCGRQGCIETYLSGPGWLARHSQHTGQTLGSVEKLLRRAGEGDADCQASLLTYKQRLARALAHVINLLDPEVIVLGGGLSNIESLYTDVPALWPAWVFSDQVLTALRPPQHGDSSGVRGAAWLWP
ncbi:ROK family protein [Sulfuriflexus mobilis]|uniref:ROK family protein n=1 Tax=Sulfuriflexus mobilis TaxID=1811807 RepID=UPI000F81E571|nr:ROK family protein [Sulfuriflexus mobilis]